MARRDASAPEPIKESCRHATCRASTVASLESKPVNLPARMPLAVVSTEAAATSFSRSRIGLRLSPKRYAARALRTASGSASLPFVSADSVTLPVAAHSAPRSSSDWKPGVSMKAALWPSNSVKPRPLPNSRANARGWSSPVANAREREPTPGCNQSSSVVLKGFIPRVMGWSPNGLTANSCGLP